MFLRTQAWVWGLLRWWWWCVAVGCHGSRWAGGEAFVVRVRYDSAGGHRSQNLWLLVPEVWSQVRCECLFSLTSRSGYFGELYGAKNIICKLRGCWEVRGRAGSGLQSGFWLFVHALSQQGAACQNYGTRRWNMQNNHTFLSPLGLCALLVAYNGGTCSSGWHLHMCYRV